MKVPRKHQVVNPGDQWIALWLFNIAMGHGPFIECLPTKNGGFPSMAMLNTQMIYIYMDMFVDVDRI